jgi:hypothetical protein
VSILSKKPLSFSITDPTQVLSYATFWNVRDSIPPYVVPAQPQSTVQQLQLSLDHCAGRIRRTREPQVTQKLVTTLSSCLFHIATRLVL